MATTYDLTATTTDVGGSALVSDGDAQPVLSAYFEMTTGAPGGITTVTNDVWQVWKIPAGTRILSVLAQAPDLADGAWEVGDGDVTDRYTTVADASAALEILDNTLGIAFKYTANDTLDIYFDTLTSVADDIKIKLLVLYCRDFAV